MSSVSGGRRASGEKSQHPLQVTIGLLDIDISTEDSSLIAGETTSSCDWHWHHLWTS